MRLVLLAALIATCALADELVERNTYTGESVCVSTSCTQGGASELKPLYSDTAESVCMNPKGCEK